jgi:signal transduction histidine kinase
MSLNASKKPEHDGVDRRKGGAVPSADEELRAVKEELAQRVSRQEDFHKGVLEMLKDLDKNEYELEEAGRMLRETRDQLVQSSKMTALGELAAGLAHELNQPLTVIKGLSMSLLNSSAPSLNREKLQLIADASDKMELIIKHLGIFSRSESAKTVPVDLAKTIDDALVMVRELLEDNRITVEMELPPLPLIQGSPNRLEQVIINLVTNAKDAMPAGGVLGISALPLEMRGREFVRLTITDTGCGIAEEYISRVFDPFFTTKAAGKGTGLGLSISYGIIKEHYGQITVESSPEGTAFHITLPIAHRHGPPKPSAEERRR